MAGADTGGCRCRERPGDDGGGGGWTVGPEGPDAVWLAALQVIPEGARAGRPADPAGTRVALGNDLVRYVGDLRAALRECEGRLAGECEARRQAEAALEAARGEAEALREALARAGEQARAERDARIEACSVAGRLADEQGRVASALEAVLLAHVLGRHAPHPARGHRPGWEARRPDGSGEPLGWYASQAEALAAVRSAAGCGDDQGG